MLPVLSARTRPPSGRPMARVSPFAVTTSRGELGRGDRRGWRQPGPPCVDERPGGSTLCSEHDDLAWAPDGQGRGLCGPRGVPRGPGPGTCSSSRPTAQRRPSGSSLQARTVCSPRGSRPTAGGSRSWAGLRPAARADCTWPRLDRPTPMPAASRPVGSRTRRGQPDGDQWWFPPQWSPDGTELAVGVGSLGGGGGGAGKRESWSSRPTVRGGTRPGGRPGVQPDLVAGRQAHRVPPHGGSIGILGKAGRARCAGLGDERGRLR